MEQTKYLIVGSSHAALEALSAIRMHDSDGSVTMATRDAHRPYSPTVLPYVVSGKSAPERIGLRDADFFERNQVSFRAGLGLRKLSVDSRVAEFADGSQIAFEKALLATGASPVVPPIDGIESVPYHVLRTLDDALRLRAAIPESKHAVVLGAGLVGMHAAENLVKAGAAVTIVEMNDRLTSGYFDDEAAALIEKAFRDNGATIRTGSRVLRLSPSSAGATTIALADGSTLEADLLLVAAGVRPNVEFLDGSGIAHDVGILVDERMQTSADNVWAAGDCAQARGFFVDRQIINSILPDATEQGRIAGMRMAGDPGAKTYVGGVALNTYHFFGRHAISVGSSAEPEGAQVLKRFDQASGRYLKAIFKDGRLLGMFGVNEFFDGGVMLQLIVRRIDLSDCRDRLFADPLRVGRELMSKHWR